MIDIEQLQEIYISESSSHRFLYSNKNKKYLSKSMLKEKIVSQK